MARVRQVIDDGVSFYEHQLDKDDGVTLFRGHARFVSEHAIECNGEQVEFEQALIAAGARPRIPTIPGLDGVPYVTSDDLLQATELPEHLVCLGAGAVALEFAQIYRRLGAQVTVVQRGARIASLEEPELSGLLRRYLEEEGIAVITEAAVERAETDGGRPVLLLADGRRITGDTLLVGIGRVPVVDGFGLAEIGIDTRPTGVVVDQRLRSTLPHVYAIGDAIGGWMFTHVATYEAPIAIANMLDGAGIKPDYRVIPRALGDRRGRVKFVLDERSGEILGAHILSRHGADLLPGAMVAMHADGRTLAPLLATIHPHPTLSEAVKIAARDG